LSREEQEAELADWLWVMAWDVNIEFFPNPDIECDNPVKIRISDFIRAA